MYNYSTLKQMISEDRKAIKKDKSLTKEEKEQKLGFLFFKLDEIKTARELCYSDEVLNRIYAEDTEGGVIRAMMSGRNAMSY
jgi:hypothetical protein